MNHESRRAMTSIEERVFPALLCDTARSLIMQQPYKHLKQRQRKETALANRLTETRLSEMSYRSACCISFRLTVQQLCQRSCRTPKAYNDSSDTISIEHSPGEASSREIPSFYRTRKFTPMKSRRIGFLQLLLDNKGKCF